MARTLAAAPAGTLRGILWHQGETDAAHEVTANTYETRLTRMFADFRQAIGQPHLRIVVGQLGDFITVQKSPYIDTMRAAIANMPNDVEPLGYVPATGLESKGDNFHFSAAAQQEFGIRYAHEMQLQQTKPTLDPQAFTFNLGEDVAGAALVGQSSDGGPLTYSVTAGALPGGVTLGTDGVFSGAPTATTTGLAATVTVNDGFGSGSALISFLVSDPNLFVNTADDSTPGTDTDADGLVSLREAIESANARPGADTITFDPTVFGTAKTIALNASLPVLGEDVTFVGPGARLLTVGAAPANAFDLFTVSNGVTATLTGMTLAYGQTALANSGAVNLSNCVLQGNGTGIGGLGTASLVACTLCGNTFGVSNTGTLTALNSTWSGNTIGVSNDATATLTNCTLSGNVMGLANTAGLMLANTLVVGNSNFDVSGDFTDGGHNITEGSAADAGLDPAGLQDNGGPTPTIALVDSAGTAVNGGDNALLPAGLATDQRGVGFKRIFGNIVDVGAYEIRLNSPPTDILLTKNSVAENAAIGANVGTLAALDPDLGDSCTFTLPPGVDDNDLFVIAAQFQIHAQVSFDYELQNSYVVTVRVTDSGGLTFDKQFVIDITETTRPTITVNTPTANSKLFQQVFLRASIRGTAEDNLIPTTVRVRLSRKRDGANSYWDGSDFISVAAFVGAAVTPTGLHSVSWALTTHIPPLAKLDAGAYSLRVWCYDAARNQSAYADSTFTLKIDNILPTVTLATPLSNQKVLTADFLAGLVRGTAADDQGVGGVKIRLSRKNGASNLYWNGTDFTPTTATVDADVTGTLNASWVLRSQLPSAAQLVAGNYTVLAYSIDQAGNLSATTTVSFVLNSEYVPPTVSIATPTASQPVDINALGSGSIIGTCDDNTGVVSIRLKLHRKRDNETTYWNGTDFTTTAALFDATIVPNDGTALWWQYNLPIPAEKLDKGGYTLYATASDAAGNAATTSARSFSVTGTVAGPTDPQLILSPAAVSARMD